MRIEIETEHTRHVVDMTAIGLADWLVRSPVDRIDTLTERIRVTLGRGQLTDTQKQAWAERNLGIRTGGCCG